MSIRTRMALATPLVLTAMVIAVPFRVAHAHEHEEEEKYLFVWAGDQARVHPDFLAVVDFDEHSDDYGSVITTVALPGPGATGNEPHHVGLTADGRVLGCGGLLSVLKGQKEVN